MHETITRIQPPRLTRIFYPTHTTLCQRQWNLNLKVQVKVEFFNQLTLDFCPDAGDTEASSTMLKGVGEKFLKWGTELAKNGATGISIIDGGMAFIFSKEEKEHLWLYLKENHRAASESIRQHACNAADRMTRDPEAFKNTERNEANSLPGMSVTPQASTHVTSPMSNQASIKPSSLLTSKSPSSSPLAIVPAVEEIQSQLYDNSNSRDTPCIE